MLEARGAPVGKSTALRLIPDLEPTQQCDKVGCASSIQVGPDPGTGDTSKTACINETPPSPPESLAFPPHVPSLPSLTPISPTTPKATTPPGKSPTTPSVCGEALCDALILDPEHEPIFSPALLVPCDSTTGRTGSPHGQGFILFYDFKVDRPPHTSKGWPRSPAKAPLGLDTPAPAVPSPRRNPAADLAVRQITRPSIRFDFMDFGVDLTEDDLDHGAMQRARYDFQALTKEESSSSRSELRAPAACQALLPCFAHDWASAVTLTTTASPVQLLYPQILEKKHPVWPIRTWSTQAFIGFSRAVLSVTLSPDERCCANPCPCWFSHSLVYPVLVVVRTWAIA
eukprot:gene8011-1428_t